MNGPEDRDRDLRDRDVPEQTSDDLDIGWGDEASDDAAARADEWYLAERPPHHGT